MWSLRQAMHERAIWPVHCHRQLYTMAILPVHHLWSK